MKLPNVILKIVSNRQGFISQAFKVNLKIFTLSHFYSFLSLIQVEPVNSFPGYKTQNSSASSTCF